VFRLSRRPGGRCFFVLLAALALNACHKPISRGECDQLLDHYVELLLKADRPEVRAEELLRLQHEARTKAAHDPTFAHCPEQVSRTQFHCAMQAKNPDRLEQCMLQ
jgi:hypothetical protein